MAPKTLEASGASAARQGNGAHGTRHHDDHDDQHAPQFAARYWSVLMSVVRFDVPQWSLLSDPDRKSRRRV